VLSEISYIFAIIAKRKGTILFYLLTRIIVRAGDFQSPALFYDMLNE
jgi:hypothetical protein